MAGQTRGAIGLSLIFCFFCIKAKEKAKTKAMQLKTVSLKIMADAFAFFVPADWNGGCMM